MKKFSIPSTIGIHPTLEFDNIEYQVGSVALLKVIDRASNNPSIKDAVSS